MPRVRRSNSAASSRASSGRHAMAAPRISLSMAMPRRPANLFPHRRVDHSPDHQRLLWAIDDKGSEFFTLKVRDAGTRADLADSIPYTAGDGTWTPDGNVSTPASTTTTAPPRSSSTRSARTGSGPACLRGSGFRHVRQRRRHPAARLASSRSATATSESRVLPAGDPFRNRRSSPPRSRLQSDIEEGSDIFFILTNADGAKDFKVVTAPAGDPTRANWQELIRTSPAGSFSRCSPSRTICPA